MAFGRWARVGISVTTLCLLALSVGATTRLKDIARIDGVRENALVGYGLVVGLAGTGDSPRNRATMQSIANALENFGVVVSDQDISGRNVAAVAIYATLPAFASKGDVVDIGVSSMGDARSLAGGTLIVTPLRAPDGNIYALAQGAISVGGFSYDLNGNLVQKNHPTVGRVPGGAIIEKEASGQVVRDGSITIILNSPDFTTAARMRNAINQEFSDDIAKAESPARINVSMLGFDAVEFISRLEAVRVEPDLGARVVINERTGTVVSGGNVRIGDVTISYGDLRVSISTQFNVSQPVLVRQTGPNVSTVVTPNTNIEVVENEARSVSLSSGATIADLMVALRAINISTRDVISILQAIKTAGSLHADLVIQ